MRQCASSPVSLIQTIDYRTPWGPNDTVQTQALILTLQAMETFVFWSVVAGIVVCLTLYVGD